MYSETRRRRRSTGSVIGLTRVVAVVVGSHVSDFQRRRRGPSGLFQREDQPIVAVQLLDAVPPTYSR